MKHFLAITTTVLLLSGTAPANQAASQPDPEHDTPTHTPEWSDHNAHDPGVAEAGKPAPRTRSGAQTAPSQNTVLGAPAAVQPKNPCMPNEGSAARPGAEDRETERLTFGDGEHGRIPKSTKADCANIQAKVHMQDGARQAQGDPDRPVITRRTANSDKED